MSTSFVDRFFEARDRLASVRALCKQTPINALRAAIEVHRTNCHQPDCSVLAALEEHTANRAKKWAIDRKGRS